MAGYLDFAMYLGSMFKIWLETIFVVPFENWEMLWLLVPVWISWFFSEFFQEKVGTSMGNAITNAVVILWGSIDCTRQTVNLMVDKAITSTLEIIGRFALVGVIFIYGMIIVRLGIKGNQIIKKIGRVRVVTYIFAMFVPVFYNAIPFSIKHFLASLLFFPIFYFVIEAIDRIVPNPKAVEQDLKEGKETKATIPPYSNNITPASIFPSNNHSNNYSYSNNQFNHYNKPNQQSNHLNQSNYSNQQQHQHQNKQQEYNPYRR